MRALLPVRSVWLYRSLDRNHWNIEVPKRHVNDVRWRLRGYKLARADHIAPTEADDHTEAFRLRIAAYDKIFADVAKEVTTALKKRQIGIYVTGDVSDLPSRPEADKPFLCRELRSIPSTLKATANQHGFLRALDVLSPVSSTGLIIARGRAAGNWPSR